MAARRRCQATVMNVQFQTLIPETDGRRILLPSSRSRAPLLPPLKPDRVVAFAALVDVLPDEFISETFSHTLRAETGCSVLLVHLQPSVGRLALADWAPLRGQINGEFGLGGHLETTEGGIGILRLKLDGTRGEEDLLESLVAHCASHFQYVILRPGVAVPMPVLLKCLFNANRVFLLARACSEDLYSRDLLLRELQMEPRAARSNLRTVICRKKGEEDSNGLLKTMGSAVHGFVHGCPTSSAAEGIRRWPDRDFNSDIRRLAREVGHRRVGLALSSGGARGLAHIGVIQVLEENGIEVDVIAGCSMGSYIGAVWAYGHDGVAMERLSREVEHRWGLFELIDPFILPRQGFLRGEKVKARLKRSIGDVHFSELIRPLRIVATHLASLDRVVFSAGEVAQAVHASSAIPGACVPVNVDGELYIDGGIADPLPVDVLEEMGIERIIAINTIPTPAYLRARLELEREREVRRGKKTNPIKSFVNRYINYFAPGNVLDTILRSFNGAQMQVAEHACQFADVVLRPLSFDGRWHDFRRPGKYIAIGRREAEEHLEEIKALVNRKEPTYEVSIAHHSMAAPA
jgi:NTE family protein